MARPRFLEDDDDPILDEREEEVIVDKDDDDESLLEEEETLEELDVDARGHVRPLRRREEFDPDIDPEY
jgi:hypothetical protein